MRHWAIIKADGDYRYLYTPAPNNPNEYPPPHGLFADDVAVEIVNDGEFPGFGNEEDHALLKEVMDTAEYSDGELVSASGRARLTVTERMRMRNGQLEDLTTTGWRRRVVFDPDKDEEGNPIHDEQGAPVGKFYVQGPREIVDGKPIARFNPVPKPHADDRIVMAGTRGAEAPHELRAKVSRTAQEWLRLSRAPRKENDDGEGDPQ